MTDPLDTAAIDRRLGAITEGPWVIWRDLDHQGFITVGNAAGVIPEGETWTDGPCEPTAHVYIEDDAEFIAHAPADIRALLDRVAELEAEQQNGEWDTQFGILSPSGFLRLTMQADRASHQRRVWYGPPTPIEEPGQQRIVKHGHTGSFAGIPVIDGIPACLCGHDFSLTGMFHIGDCPRKQLPMVVGPVTPTSDTTGDQQ